MTTFIGGLPEAEYYRRQALPSRPLTRADVPNLEWMERYSDLFLREDGAILSSYNGKLGQVGTLDDKGSIAFDMA